MAYDADSTLDLQQYTSIVDLIEKSCHKFADNTAYACLGKNTTFKEIEQDSRHFAAYLQHCTDLQPGDKVALQLPNITQFVIAAYGIIRAGMVLVNTQYKLYL